MVDFIISSTITFIFFDICAKLDIYPDKFPGIRVEVSFKDEGLSFRVLTNSYQSSVRCHTAENSFFFSFYVEEVLANMILNVVNSDIPPEIKVQRVRKNFRFIVILVRNIIHENQLDSVLIQVENSCFVPLICVLIFDFSLEAVVSVPDFLDFLEGENCYENVNE